jgi:hypothetical protein
VCHPCHCHCCAAVGVGVIIFAVTIAVSVTNAASVTLAVTAPYVSSAAPFSLCPAPFLSPLLSSLPPLLPLLPLLPLPSLLPGIKSDNTVMSTSSIHPLPCLVAFKGGS